MSFQVGIAGNFSLTLLCIYAILWKTRQRWEGAKNMKKALLLVISILLVFSLISQPIGAAAEVSAYAELAMSAADLAKATMELYTTGPFPGPVIEATVSAISVVVNMGALADELKSQYNSALESWLSAHFVAFNISVDTHILAYRLVYQMAAEDPSKGISVESRRDILITLTDNLIESFDQNIESANKLLDEHGAWFVIHDYYKTKVEETRDYSVVSKNNLPNFYELYKSLRK